ncbi:MAG: hypothetical protein GY807_24585 [Gammaproteobacteria bacterium]|nr:hypothetical protein [Gammaproteobacteria bacterium]
MDWELRFTDLKETLMMYALMNSFLVQVIEEDELYTKVGKNVPVQDCEGWTIVLMDRATRFIDVKPIPMPKRKRACKEH